MHEMMNGRPCGLRDDHSGQHRAPDTLVRYRRWVANLTPKQLERRRAYSRERSREYRRRNPEQARQYKRAWDASRVGRDHYLQRIYGITLSEYEQRLAEQDGVCAICGSSDPKTKNGEYFCVDHDHETGSVRGLLCVTCNRTLGGMDDNSARLRTAAKYLEQ